MGTPVWKGQLSYAGRSFAAKILTGPRGENVSFNQLHRPDLSRVKQVLHCAQEDKPIARDELVKGFEYSKDEFIVLEEAEIKALAPAAPETIELKTFVPLDQVDPLYFESSYYVAPGSTPGQDAEQAYAALFGALRRTSLAGIQIVCLYSRERPLLFRAGKTGIVAHALFYAHELRSLDEFRTRVELTEQPEALAAGKDLRRILAHFTFDGYPDGQRERTEALIAKKVAMLKVPGKPVVGDTARKRARERAVPAG